MMAGVCWRITIAVPVTRNAVVMTKKWPAPRERGASPVGSIADGTRPEDGCRRTSSVKVAELIVEACFDIAIGGVERRRLDRFRLVVRTAPARPAHRDQADADESARSEDVRHGPREAIEAGIDGGCQRLLAAVFREVVLNDLFARL